MWQENQHLICQATVLRKKTVWNLQGRPAAIRWGASWWCWWLRCSTTTKTCVHLVDQSNNPKQPNASTNYQSAHEENNKFASDPNFQHPSFLPNQSLHFCNLPNSWNSNNSQRRSSPTPSQHASKSNNIPSTHFSMPECLKNPQYLRREISPNSPKALKNPGPLSSTDF